MADVLIIGGGICGLGTALLLARDGHDVTVLERDAAPVPDTPQDAWDAWERRGVTQFRQPHNFMPGLRLILESELPDVQQALLDAGASRFDMVNPLPPFFADQSPRPIDDKLWTYTARRPAGDWVFAAAARREPRVTVRRGVQAAGLLTGASAVGEYPFAGGPAGRVGPQLVVDRSRRLIGEERRQRVHHVEPTAAGIAERLLDVGQFGVEDQPQAGHEVVRLAELRDAPALPHVPRVLRRVGHRGGVALEHRDVVAVASEQQRGPQTADPTADDENVRHGSSAGPALYCAAGRSCHS